MELYECICNCLDMNCYHFERPLDYSQDITQIRCGKEAIGGLGGGWNGGSRE